jgi:DNA-binding response OmpR family regulator
VVSEVDCEVVSLEEALMIQAVQSLTEEFDDVLHVHEVCRFIRAYQSVSDLMRERLQRTSPPSTSGHVDQEASLGNVRRWLDYVEARLEFWHGRLRELQGIDLDPVSLVVRHADRSIQLTQREFQLLSYFLRHPGRVCRARELVQLAWTSGHLKDDQLRIYIGRLRDKMRSIDLPCQLVNVSRKGYRLDFA